MKHLRRIPLRGPSKAPVRPLTRQDLSELSCYLPIGERARTHEASS